MYEKFTDRSRKVLHLANVAAIKMKHQGVTPVHLLLGLAEEGSGVAANVLRNFDMPPHKLYEEVEKVVEPGTDEVLSKWLPHSTGCKKAIERSIEEARNLNHNYVGTEHLLLGLLREEGGVPAQVLSNFGVTIEDVREEILNLLGAGVTKDSHKELLAKVKKIADEAEQDALNKIKNLLKDF
jgi:ATP-dependent Clp protease ATP-binding subunit ClpC